MVSSNRGGAPPEMLRKDFAILDSRETLRTNWAIEEILLIQSVQGHAHEGHGIFRGHRFPNTTLDDVVQALRRDTTAVKGARQALIDEVRGYARSAVIGSGQAALVDDLGNPLLGVSTLRFLRVNPLDVLRGLYLGGLRDDPDLRAETEAETGLRIGGGRSYHVDFAVLDELGLTADDLAHGEWAGRIDDFRERGLIVEGRDAERRTVHYQYVRHRRGCGASDDAAIVGAGFVWGLGVALGVFLADAVDTLEKYVPRYSDQDEDIAMEIEHEMPDLGVARHDVKRLIRIAVGDDGNGKDLPDSSLRHLLSVDRDTDLCALEAHILAVQGTPAPTIGLGHDRVPSDRFYETIRERAQRVGA